MPDKWARARAQAIDRVQHPTRQEHLLREAVESTGIEVVAYEWEVEDDATGGHHWFDVCAVVDDQLVFIDLVNDPAKGGVTKREKAIYQEKRDLAERWGVPLLQVHGSPLSEMESRIRYWFQWEVSRWIRQQTK